MKNKKIQIENCTIYRGDCLDILDDIGSVNVSIVDPPYNNGTKYKSYNDKRNDYKEWCTAWFNKCRSISTRVLITPGHGNLWMWGEIEKPWGIGSWYKPGNTASSVCGWVCWEPWLYYCKDYKALGGPDTIRATVSKQKNVGNHPCPKPLDLISTLVQKISKKDQIILDPFMGSGTTAIASIRTGRKFIGIEIDEQYFEDSHQRIKQEYKQIKMF